MNSQDLHGPVPAPAHALTAPPKQSLGKHARDLVVLTRIQLLVFRQSWIWVLLLAPFISLSVLAFLRFFVEDPTPERAAYFITGSITYNLVLATTLSLGQIISWQRHQGHFEYYISLPVHKLSFIFSLIIQGLAQAVPGILIVGTMGRLLFDVTLHFNPAVIPFVLLSMASMSGFGAFIGFWSPTTQVSNYSTQVLHLVVNFLSPVLIPMTALPIPLQWFARLLPSTYAADGLRNLLTVGWTPDVTTDTLCLIGFTLLTAWLVIWKIDWRGQE